MNTSKSQTGFSIVEVIVIIAMVAIVGLLGYVAYNSFTEASTTVDTAKEAVDSNANSLSQDIVVPAAPATVESSADLDDVNKLLDEIDLSVDSVDDASLDSELSNF